MATRLVQPGLRKVADAAFPTRQMPAQLRQDGFEVLCGYLSTPTGNGKNWTPERLAWCEEAGIGVGMFCEQFETIVYQGYSDANLALGSQCERMANSFGYPDDCYMWFAVDTSPFGYETQIVEAFQAYQDTNHRPLACYGGSQIIDLLMDEGLVVAGHIPSAVSWSNCAGPANGETVFVWRRDKFGNPDRWYYKTPRAHMVQHVSESYAGSRIDANDVLRPTPFWFPGEPDPIQPHEEDMTDEQARQLAEIHAALPTINAVYRALTADPGTGITMEWAVQQVYDAIAKGHLAAQVAAAVQPHGTFTIPAQTVTF